MDRGAWQTAAAAAKSLQSYPTLCDPIDGSPPGSPFPGTLQARILEWVAISFSNAWKWKVKVKSFSFVLLLATPWTAAYQASWPWDFPGKSTGVGCHCLLQGYSLGVSKESDTTQRPNNNNCSSSKCTMYKVVLLQNCSDYSSLRGFGERGGICNLNRKILIIQLTKSMSVFSALQIN